MPRLDADAKNIPQFEGGNVKQRDHLNKVVDALNHQRNLIEGLDAAGQNPLQMIVGNARGDRLSLVEVANANHIADFGAFHPTKLTPWQPFITGADTNEQGRAKRLYVDFNPLSTLWGMASSEWDNTGQQWNKQVDITNFAVPTHDPVSVTSGTDVIWLEVVVGAYLSLTSATLRSGPRWATWPKSYDKTGGGSGQTYQSGATIYQLLVSFRPARTETQGEKVDVIFEDGVKYAMIQHTCNDLLVGILRQNYGSGAIGDFAALLPWFKTYKDA
ncbi:hypothetical protein UFOVP930_3 [uncultured Caudovirales phage]|uniref:Uncharacterized protein n=1 Tax=uncultured Caudovirales phage TaxID=2100421 RepID=A0A6J5RTG4_9CAUD|nr:hypothetical protein UFOVP930_3 [uncultured Caudovirales phage]CAB4200713.1 hypothetical protein UFOVP1354_63 [uncultured Caudovirales phage]CAB5238572.1 hypothetical protein UFOVP1547_55 [uncultured Caudovirales phage]